MFRAMETIYEGRVFKLRRIQAPLLHGKALERELIVHPGSVVILAINTKGELVMIRNLRFAVGEELWELPAGTLEEGESPIECAKRELGTRMFEKVFSRFMP